MEKINKINELNVSELESEFRKCCSSEKWINKMMEGKPYSSERELFDTARNMWYSLEERDWREAFLSHPKIGDLKTLMLKYAQSKALSESEQSGINNAAPETLSELAEFNTKYEKKFGYIFIVCATGKSADEILSMIKKRINNKPEDEIKIAMKEQLKIMELRLEKLF